MKHSDKFLLYLQKILTVKMLLKAIPMALLACLCMLVSCSKDEETNMEESEGEVIPLSSIGETLLNPSSSFKLYAYDDDGNLNVLDNPFRTYAIQHFSEVMCGHCWKPVKMVPIDFDGNWYQKGAVDEVSAFAYYDYFIEKDSIIQYTYNDVPPYYFYCDTLKTSYDEKTGTIMDRAGNRLLTIVAIVSKDLVFAIDWRMNWDVEGRYIHLVLKRMTDKEYRQTHSNSDLWPAWIDLNR